MKLKTVGLNNPLTPTELEDVMNALVYLVQREPFGVEISTKGIILSNEVVNNLNPFLLIVEAFHSSVNFCIIF